MLYATSLQINEPIIFFKFKLLCVGFCQLQLVSTNISDVEKTTSDAKFYLWLWENKNTTQCYYTFMIIRSNILKLDKICYFLMECEWMEN